MSSCLPMTLPAAFLSLEAIEQQGQSKPVDHEQIVQWIARLKRHEEDDPRRLLALAGKYSAPQHRKGARFFAPKPGLNQQQMLDITSSALQGQTHALSGVAAARTYLGHAPDPGPVLAWATDIETAAAHLTATLRETSEYQPAGVIVAPTLDAYFVDTLQQPFAEYTVVAAIQAAIDLHGLGYHQLAEQITEGW